MGENQQFKVDSIKLMDKIIERFDLLTSAEKRVCNFIVENRDKVICMHINDLAEKTFTSKTVVINMAKRLGFAGYADIKYYLKSLVNNESEHKSELDILSIVKMSEDLLNQKLLKLSAKYIRYATTVYVAARGTSKTCALYLNRLLVIAGVKCVLIDDYNLLTTAAHKVDKKELFILISLSGETAKMIETAKIIQSRQAKIISMTSFTNNSLSKLADINLYAASDSVDTLKDDDKTRIGVFIVIEQLVKTLKNLPM